MEAAGGFLLGIGLLFVAGALPFYALAARSALRLARGGGARAEWARAGAAGLAWLASVTVGVGLVVVGAVLRDWSRFVGGFAP